VLIERFNRTLRQLLSIFAHQNPQDWDDHLPYLLMAYRATEHSSTKCIPNLMMLGREITMPIDLMVGMPPFKNVIMTLNWKNANTMLVIGCEEFVNYSLRPVFNPTRSYCNVPNCNSKFARFPEYVKHWKMVHKETIYVYSCNICQKRFRRKERAVSHA
jgi:hypothetical protein